MKSEKESEYEVVFKFFLNRFKWIRCWIDKRKSYSPKKKTAIKVDSFKLSISFCYSKLFEQMFEPTYRIFTHWRSLSYPM